MDSIQLMQSLMKVDSTTTSKEITVRQGQILYGRVEKLFPNQTALLQIGSMKFQAYIDATVVPKEQYWFEAQTTQSGELRLKVIDIEHSGQAKLDEVGGALLKRFQLPDTKVNQQIVHFFLSKELAFSREHLSNASKWLSNTQDLQKGLTAIEIMIKKHLPQTVQTFKSIVALQTSESLSTQIEQVAKFLSDSKIKQTETIQKLRTLLPKILGEISEEQGQRVVREISKLWLSSESTLSEQRSSLRLLQKLDLISNKYSIEQPQQVLNQVLKESYRVHPVDRANPQHIERLVNTFVQTVSNQELKKIPKLLTEIINDSKQSLVEDELRLFKKVQNQVFPQAYTLADGAEVKHLIKRMISTLGLDYETGLGARVKPGAAGNVEYDSLKPLLLKALGELGSNARDIEPLLNRITGLQLISQETNGPLQQIIMQIPLNFGDKLSDVTLQWSGRKKKNGQIDPSFCRILFYIDLQNIEQTVIDMNVQNRIINITIINNKDGIDSILSSQELELKDKLSSIDYVLSTVKVIASSMPKNELDNQGRIQSMVSKKTYQGVDYKI